MQKEKDDMAAKEVTVTFKTSEALAEMLQQAMMKTDKNKSELIRCCLLLGLHTVIACPSLTNRIAVEDFIRNNNKGI